jgi:hypothetical protein
MSFNYPFQSPTEYHYQVGIPSEKFNIVVDYQRKSQWCWAATIQIIYNYYGVDITQEQIVARSYGVDPATGIPPDNPATFELINKNLNGNGFDNTGRRYFVRAQLYIGPPDVNRLIRTLNEQRPMLIGCASGPNSGHAVIVSGCSYIQTFFGPQIQTLVVRDPDPAKISPYDLHPGRLIYNGKDLADLIQRHWYIDIF